MNNYIWGLDLSLSCSGIAIYDTVSGFFIVHSIPTDKIRKQKNKYHNALKLWHIAEEILLLKEKYPPTVVAIERSFSRFNTSTAVINQVVGLILYLLHDINIIFYPPKKVKEAIFKGDATKKQIQDIIKKKYNYLDFKNEDESDSVSVCVCFLIQEGLIEWIKEKPVKIVKSIKPKNTKKKVDKCKK